MTLLFCELAIDSTMGGSVVVVSPPELWTVLARGSDFYVQLRITSATGTATVTPGLSGSNDGATWTTTNITTGSMLVGTECDLTGAIFNFGWKFVRAVVQLSTTADCKVQVWVAGRAKTRVSRAVDVLDLDDDSLGAQSSPGGGGGIQPWMRMLGPGLSRVASSLNGSVSGSARAYGMPRPRKSGGISAKKLCCDDCAKPGATPPRAAQTAIASRNALQNRASTKRSINKRPGTLSPAGPSDSSALGNALATATYADFDAPWGNLYDPNDIPPNPFQDFFDDPVDPDNDVRDVVRAWWNDYNWDEASEEFGSSGGAWSFLEAYALLGSAILTSGDHSVHHSVSTPFYCDPVALSGAQPSTIFYPIRQRWIGQVAQGIVEDYSDLCTNEGICFPYLADVAAAIWSFEPLVYKFFRGQGLYGGDTAEHVTINGQLFLQAANGQPAAATPPETVLITVAACASSAAGLVPGPCLYFHDFRNMRPIAQRRISIDRTTGAFSALLDTLPRSAVGDYDAYVVVVQVDGVLSSDADGNSLPPPSPFGYYGNFWYQPPGASSGYFTVGSGIASVTAATVDLVDAVASGAFGPPAPPGHITLTIPHTDYTVPSSQLTTQPPWLPPGVRPPRRP